MTKPWVGASVLVVDDSEKIRDELSQVLTALGLNVVKTATNGLEALNYLKETAVDVVTVDIIMPIMHGIELYREMKILRPQQKAFFVTLLAREKKFIDSYKGEIEEELFQGKPFSQLEIEQKLAHIYQYSDKPKSENDDVPLKTELISHQFLDG